MKIKILLALLLFILTIGAASATDNNLTVGEESNLTDENAQGTFSQLSALIENTSEGSALELEKDYLNNDDEKEISISKSITIDGKNHILDGNAHEIFYIDAPNVILKNIIFKNGHATFGGSIYSSSDNITIENCKFEDSMALDCRGGAIYADFGNNWNIINTTFTNKNTINPYDYGMTYNGAIAGDGNNWNIVNSKFINCNDFLGGAIYSKGNSWNIINSSFEKCRSTTGGAISASGDNWNIINSTFTHCMATLGTSRPSNGGAIYSSGANCKIANSTFSKCSAHDEGGAIYFNGKSPKLLNSKFNGNTADKYPNYYSSKAIITTITASNLKTVYTASPYYTIKTYDSNGKLTDKTKVVVKLNGKSFKTLTSKNGIAKFKITQTPGTYKLTITALKNTVAKTLTVKHIVALKKVTVKKSAKKLTLKAALAKINGKYLKNKKVTFKFNNKKYTSKTDSKGITKVTIKKAMLNKLKIGKKITYQATYLKDTVKKTVKVQR